MVWGRCPPAPRRYDRAGQAPVAELVDAPDSKSGGGNIVLVRVRPGAPISFSPISAVPLPTRLAHVAASGGRAAVDFTHDLGALFSRASSCKWRTRRGSLTRKPCNAFDALLREFA